MTEQLEKILNDLPYSIRHSGEIEELKEFAREQAELVEGLLEQTGHNFEVNRKLDAENQRYKQALELVEDELEYAKTTGNDEVRDMYIKNSIRFINEALEGECHRKG